MFTLGIESSCDETACAVVKDNAILAQSIASQDIHSEYGGVVPELASRAHLQALPSLLKKTVSQANINLQDIDLIAVSSSPGLIGSLAVGLNFSKGLSSGLNKPLIGVNHVEAHLYAAYMQQPSSILFPALGVVISGAHTSLFFMRNTTTFELIGKTRDDALGETFDKVARILGFPYPGGPHIEKAACLGDHLKYPFSEGIVPSFDFSFSGLKTAVLYTAKGYNSKGLSHETTLSPDTIHDIAASFQHAAFKALLKKIPLALSQFSCKTILIGGGVASNTYFRNELQKILPLNIKCFFPDKILCSDNAAMIAGLGTELYLKDYPKSIENISPKARSSWASVVHD